MISVTKREYEELWVWRYGGRHTSANDYEGLVASKAVLFIVAVEWDVNPMAGPRIGQYTLLIPVT